MHNLKKYDYFRQNYGDGFCYTVSSAKQPLSVIRGILREYEYTWDDGVSYPCEPGGFFAVFTKWYLPFSAIYTRTRIGEEKLYIVDNYDFEEAKQALYLQMFPRYDDGRIVITLYGFLDAKQALECLGYDYWHNDDAGQDCLGNPFTYYTGGLHPVLFDSFDFGNFGHWQRLTVFQNEYGGKTAFYELKNLYSEEEQSGED